MFSLQQTLDTQTHTHKHIFAYVYMSFAYIRRVYGDGSLGLCVRINMEKTYIKVCRTSGGVPKAEKFASIIKAEHFSSTVHTNT